MGGRGEAGQSAAELAVLLPVLLLILLGCLDLGRAYAVWTTLANASREGARYACLHPSDTVGITNETKTDVLAAGLTSSSLRVEVSAPTGHAAQGAPIAVTARYTLPLMTAYLFGGKPLVVKAVTQMVIIGGGS